jgi:hypothetical protein
MVLLGQLGPRVWSSGGGGCTVMGGLEGRWGWQRFAKRQSRHDHTCTAKEEMNCQEYISTFISFCIGIKLSKMYAGNGNMHR